MYRLRFHLSVCLILLVISTIVFSPKDGVADQLSESYIRTQETTYRSGDIEIAATLLIPAGNPPYPAAVIIQGAGESSRENPWARQIGEHLASRGIAAYLPDKRGTGDSEGDWHTAGFSDLADDIVAAVHALLEQSTIDNEAIGVVGLSQGGFYAPVVADKSAAVVFVGAVSASVMSFEATINHEMSNTFAQAGVVGEAHQQAMAVQMAAIGYARSGDWEAYITERDRALAGPAAEVIEGFPSNRDHWRWEWIRQVMDFDPMEHWRSVSQPVFFAFGEDDEEDNVPVAESVARIKAELPSDQVILYVYPESGHALWDPTFAKEGKAVVRGDFADDLANWIKEQVLRAQ